jgi:hypothetical protein
MPMQGPWRGDLWRKRGSKKGGVMGKKPVKEEEWAGE